MTFFQLQLSSVWLREEHSGGMVFFPDHTSTTFNISPSDCPLTLIVEGQPEPSAAEIRPTTAASGLVSTPAVSTPRTAVDSQVPHFSGRRAATCNVKIVQANLHRLPGGRVEFDPQGQMWVDVSDATANVNHILSAVQRNWGTDQVLVTADGLKIEDSSGTQGKYKRISLIPALCHYFFFHRSITGFKFWRVGSRKIYSVSEQQLGPRQALRPSKRPRALRWEPHASESESTDFERQPPTRRSTSVLREIREMRTELATAIDNVRRQLPRDLHRHLSESLSCCICRDIMNPPIIFSRCCQRLLGCRQCLEHAYEQNRRCPFCRQEGVLPNQSQEVRGLEELIRTIRPYFSDSASFDASEHATE